MLEDTLQPGKICGRWLLLRRSDSREDGQWVWDCVCSCGEKRRVPCFNLLRGKSKSCGCYRVDFNRSRIGPRSPTWRGGRIVTSNGYVRVSASHLGKRKKESEHRLVMEQKLGRSLFSFETVHHINGDRGDNRPENLELWAKAHCPGQRVADLVRWAEQILQVYQQNK